MGHDHAASERERQEYETRERIRRLEREEQAALVMEGALARISTGVAGPQSASQTAKQALDAARRLRSDL